MKTHGPWKIKSSKEIYKNPWIEVQEDKVIRPDGKDGIFSTIRISDGAHVLPIDKNGYVYLTKEFHYAISKYDIEIISGGIDKNETLLHAAKRELKEESGISAKKWIYLGKINPFTTIVKSPSYLYIASELSFGDSDLEGTEKIEILKMKFKDALKMVMQGEITHSPSCVLILKAEKYLKNK